MGCTPSSHRSHKAHHAAQMFYYDIWKSNMRLRELVRFNISEQVYSPSKSAVALVALS
jgi:hypothetical protein